LDLTIQQPFQVQKLDLDLDLALTAFHKNLKGLSFSQ
jgi:hypothetical protein